MRIKNKKQLPKEFDLNNYNCLSDLSDKQLIEQIRIRLEIIDVKSDVDSVLWYIINGGNVSFDDVSHNKNEFEVKYYNHLDTANVLSCETGISPLSRGMIQTVCMMNDQIGVREGKPIFISEDECAEIMSNGDDYHGLIRARASDSISLISSFGCWVDVDLSYPDDLLINRFSELLAKWRVELGCDNKSEVAKFNKWKVMRDKIIKYKVIQYLDLMKWAEASFVKIPVRVIVCALYPDSEQDSFSFTQTIKPFIEKVTSELFIEKMEMEISNNKFQ